MRNSVGSGISGSFLNNRASSCTGWTNCEVSIRQANKNMNDLGGANLLLVEVTADGPTVKLALNETEIVSTTEDSRAELVDAPELAKAYDSVAEEPTSDEALDEAVKETEDATPEDVPEVIAEKVSPEAEDAREERWEEAADETAEETADKSEEELPADAA